MLSLQIHGLRFVATLAVVASQWACSGIVDTPTATADSPALRQAKGGPTAGPVVTAANPAYGKQGETGKVVAISGTGFTPGSTVAWERNGVIDANVTVQSAVVISSSRIDATITIASDAELSFYDIAVTSADRKKGIGTEMFEVTTAVSIGTLGGNTQARAANDNVLGAPRVVGYSIVSNVMHAFYWPDANGRMGDLGPGNANGIDQNGRTIAGDVAGFGVVWTSSGSGWIQSRLPVAAGAPGSHVEEVASGPDGSALYVGGAEKFQGTRKNSTLDRPRLWKFDNGIWNRIVLEMPRPEADAFSWVVSVNSAGLATGAVRVGVGASQPVFWDAIGNATILPGPLGSGTAGGSNPDGTLVAGFAGSVASYWTSVVNTDGSRTWKGPFSLPGGCERAVGMDDSGRIIGNRCPLSGGNGSFSAVWSSPLAGSPTITVLHGIGNTSDWGTAWAISPQGSLIAGWAGSGSVNVGVIWPGLSP